MHFHFHRIEGDRGRSIDTLWQVKFFERVDVLDVEVLGSHRLVCRENGNVAGCPLSRFPPHEVSPSCRGLTLQIRV